MPALTSTFQLRGATLTYELEAPVGSSGLIVFVHGSGSSRRSPRNQYVAAGLRRAGLATLLFDLLTEEEGQDREKVFDIELLARRLVDALRWVPRQPRVGALPVGLFGASTGAAAALLASISAPVRAIVSRGGRPDLAAPALPRVSAPTLLIVGGDDPDVLELNREAARHLRCAHALEVVPGASHLFEEPGTLDAVVGLARAWFTSHLAAA